MEILPKNLEENYYPLTSDTVVSSPVNLGVDAPNTPATPVSDSNIVPSANGSMVNNGTLQSPNFVTGASGSGWKLDSNGNLECNDGNFRGDITGATGTFSGTVNVGSLNIPDATTANSFHVDVDGNAWLGANVANKATAPIRLNKDGTAYFVGVTTLGSSTDEFSQIAWNSTNMVVNGSIISNNSVFGDGSDGDVTISVDTTLTSDMYYNNLTIATTKILNPGGYRIFVKGTLTYQGTGKIARNGNAGGDASGQGTGGTVGTAGAALASGSIYGSYAGKAGRLGGESGSNPQSGTAGSNADKSIGLAGVAGGKGGDGSGGQTSTGGAGGSITDTVYNTIKNVTHAILLVDFTPSLLFLKPSPGSGSGGGGGVSYDGGAPYANGGCSGGSGSSGGIVLVLARKIVTVDGNVYLQADGGKGGNGSAGADDPVPPVTFSGGGGGGGGGGNGGVVILVYSSKTGAGTISVAGGAKGTGGTSTYGNAGVDGTAGQTGKTVILQV